MSLPRRGRVARKSLRDALADSNRWDKFYALSAGLPPRAQAPIPAKRAYTKRTDTGPSEAQVLKSVLAYLRRHPLILTVERSQSGVFRDGDRHIRVGFVGKLDVTFMTKQGRYGEVEIKKPGKKPTEAQAARIAKIKSGGGISGYVTSVDEMEALLCQPNSI